ncbi:unnamed protein product [Leptosia nina]|uniref:Fanconi-associated nuclease n=1 Tax=Leptosia nina TaxID=320188 RepID=A0AAV1JMD7_9NEOP
MPRQLKMDNFYKSKVSKTLIFERDENIQVSVKCEMETPKKRLTPALKEPSPFKTPKINDQDVISLISDEEDSLDVKNEMNDSDTTITYSPVQQSPTTSSASKSPVKKYYSPNKKRSLTIRTPKRVRKNLNKIICDNSVNHPPNRDFVEACQGLDDKTIFLLRIIHQYLNNTRLKPLLEQSSQNLLQKCMNLVKPGLIVICRLYWRKDGWYKLEKIAKVIQENKQSVDDFALKEMLNSLIQNGLITASHSKNNLKFDDYYDMLNVNDVKAICKEFKLKFTSKDTARQSLLNFCNQKSIGNYFGMRQADNLDRVLNSLRSKCGECFKLKKITRKTLDELHVLMYLGIDRSILADKKLELTLIYDKAKRETYPVDEKLVIDNASVVFKDRHEFERYITASMVYDEFYNTDNSLERRRIVENVYTLYQDISKSDMTSYKSLPVWLRRFTPAHIYVKILESGIPELKKPPEKEKCCQLALDVFSMLITQDAFRQHKKVEWYDEIALIYETLLGDTNKAAETLIEGFKLDLKDSEMDCLRVRARKLVKRVTNRPTEKLCSVLSTFVHSGPMERTIKAIHVHKQPKESLGRGKIKFEVRLPQSLMVMDVEEFCKYHYIEQGKYTHGEHWESTMIRTLFALLFWDVIYTELRSVRGIFLTRFQKYPLDMFTESFYANRRYLIDDRLTHIEQTGVDDLVASMKSTWDSRPECEISDIQRSKISWENVEVVTKCLGSYALAAICRRLALDYRYSHSGFPDLTLWNPHTKQIIFVEVKTDKDKPSIKQLQWMKYLEMNNIDTEFCYIGTNTMANGSRNKTEV